MERTMKVGRCGLLVVALVAGLIKPAAADLLNPLDYASQGALAIPANASPSFVVTETPGSGGSPGTVTLAPIGGGMTYNAVISNNGVAVFDFDSISVGAGSTIRNSVQDLNYTLPVAFLSRGDINIAGTINFDPASPIPSTYLYGGPGGGSGGSYNQSSTGPGAGGEAQPRSGGGGGGAGFGGMGGDAGKGGAVPGSTGGSGGGGAGGASYGNLAVALQGGSGGGFGYPTFLSGTPTNGGSGGGGIEIGAVGHVTIRGAILADGSAGNNGMFDVGGGGGGSGGGIIIHGGTVTIPGILSANGGAGGMGGTLVDPPHVIGGGGGGGAGGRILIAYGAGGLGLTSSPFSVSGAAGGAPGSMEAASGLNGADGTVTMMNTVPEPSAWVSLALGACGLLAARKSRALS